MKRAILILAFVCLASSVCGDDVAFLLSGGIDLIPAEQLIFGAGPQFELLLGSIGMGFGAEYWRTTTSETETPMGSGMFTFCVTGRLPVKIGPEVLQAAAFGGGIGMGSIGVDYSDYWDDEYYAKTVFCMPLFALAEYSFYFRNRLFVKSMLRLGVAAIMAGDYLYPFASIQFYAGKVLGK
jgi:hypothetical protein